MISSLILKIKRRETGLARALYRLAKTVLGLSVPSVKWIHLPLYHLDFAVKEGVRHVVHACWSVPLFRARCSRVGKNLRLPNGIPYVTGDNLKIVIGDNVTIMRSTIGANKVYDEPVLRIGSNSTLGYGTMISVAREVSLGEHCMIAPGCTIMDSDDHPLQPGRRRAGEGVRQDEIAPVTIGNNVWIGSNCAILKGATIGDNAVIATHSVITRDVAANCVYAGYPARPTLRDLDKLP